MEKWTSNWVIHEITLPSPLEAIIKKQTLVFLVPSNNTLVKSVYVGHCEGSITRGRETITKLVCNGRRGSWTSPKVIHVSMEQSVVGLRLFLWGYPEKCKFGKWPLNIGDINKSKIARPILFLKIITLLQGTRVLVECLYQPSWSFRFQSIYM